MALVGRMRKTHVETIEYEITAPDEWGMYSKKGDRSLQKKAQNLLDRVEKLKEQNRLTKWNVSNALVSFVASWERMKYSKSFGEACDTDVREAVGGFHDAVWNALFGGGGDEMWDFHYSKACHRVRNERNKKSRT